jgi:hypothetical protein
MPPRKESELQRAIVCALRACGFWVVRTGVSSKRGKSGTQSGEPGYPDLDLPALGRIEVKMPGKELDPDQSAWHAKAARHGIRIAVARTVQEALTTAVAWRAEWNRAGVGIRVEERER